METRQFQLELSGNAGVPSQCKITLKDIIKWMKIQAKNLKDVEITDHFHRGAFTFSTENAASARFLASFKLEMKWNSKTYRLPLKEVTPDRPRTRIMFLGTNVGEMRRLPHTYFDDILEKEGFNLLVPTKWDDHFDSPFRNGRRFALGMRATGHVEREHVWYGEEGHVYKWKLIYDGQPHECRRGCHKRHEDGICPKFQQEKERRSFEGQQKVFVVGSSLLRHCSDTKDVRTDSIPGAKVGHIAHHINNDGTIFEKAETLVIHAGANMDYGAAETTKPLLEEQARELVQVVKPMAETGKKVFVVDPVAGPLVKEAPGGDHWAMVRSRMKKAAKEMNAEWVSLENLNWIPEEDIAEDGHHYSAKGTKKMMEAVAQRVQSCTGNNIIADMDFPEQQYEKIYRKHWKYGCYRCTKIHPRGPCPPPPEELLNTSIPGPTNSSSNSVDSFHSIGNATRGQEDSEESLGLSNGPSPGGTPIDMVAVTRSQLQPTNNALTAPVSAAVAAAAAATLGGEGLSLQYRGSATSPFPSDPRNRSSSAKRGRVSSDEISGNKDAGGKRPKDHGGPKGNGHQSRLSLDKNVKK